MKPDKTQSMTNKKLTELCQILKVLSNPNRLNILILLLEGEFSVGQIESLLKIRQPNLSHELKKLRAADLVSFRRESKAVFYRLGSEATRALVQSTWNLTGNSGITMSPAKIKVSSINQGKLPECGIFANISPQPIM